MQQRVINKPHGISIKLTRHAIERRADRGDLHQPEDPIPNYGYSRARSLLKKTLLRNGTAQRTPPTETPTPPCVYLEHEGWVAVLLRPRRRLDKHWICVTCFPIPP